MISCFFRLPIVDGQPVQCAEGNLCVCASTDDLITISMHADRSKPLLFCTLDLDEARALADALRAGADLVAAGAMP